MRPVTQTPILGLSLNDKWTIPRFYAYFTSLNFTSFYMNTRTYTFFVALDGFPVGRVILIDFRFQLNSVIIKKMHILCNNTIL